jgi:hypothetical protein
MGAWTEIVDYTVPSNTTSVVFNDFGTITKDDFIKIVTSIKNANSSAINTRLFVNTATTTTNYHRQILSAVGSTVGAFRSNAARFTAVSGSGESTTVAYLKLSENNVANWITNRTFDNGSNIETVFQCTTSSGATFSSGITSLTFESETASAIAAGSRIQIYRLDAEKVADFVTTSNSTQVDIPVTGSLDPAITKDDEYLLVSDITAGTSTGIRLFVNDNTTATDYYVQSIQGNGSTASASRGNNASITGGSGRFLNYTHIKLSEIGAYTNQSYSIREYGTSSLILENNFVSSTAENITSITKLNFFASAANGLGSGSRFILYKLK